MTRKAPKRTLEPINGYRGPSGGSNVYELPAGQYWIKSADGRLGVTLTVGTDGPYGIGLQIDTHVGTPTLTIASPDGNHIELCQYRDDPKSQAFRRWYLHQETPADLALLGPEYRRGPAEVAK